MAALADRPSVTIADLACGTGSTFRALSPRIKARQNWRLADNDLSLLARAPQSSPPHVNVATVPVDLNHDLEAALDGPVDLVTTSALLDLVSDEWLERFAVEAAARRLPVYAALSYDGRIEMTPADAADAEDRRRGERASAHRQGLWPGARAGGREGRGRAVRARRLFGRAGRGRLGVRPKDRDIQLEMLSGWAAAAREIGDVPLARRGRMADAPPRPRRRRPFHHPRRSRRLLRAADRHALSRQVAVEQHLVVEPVHAASASGSASSTRAIGGSEKLVRPEPRMIGATMMCSRSRHFAARKRDTVSAPPSISTRRRPRSASADKDRRRRDLPVGLGDADDLDVGRQRRPRARAGHHQAAHAIVGEQLGAGRQPPAGIDHDPRRLRSGYPPHRELRIVGQRRADPDHHRVDQRAQPVQMRQARPVR